MDPDKPDGQTKAARTVHRPSGAQTLHSMVRRIFGITRHYRLHRRWIAIISGRNTERFRGSFPNIDYRHSAPYLFEDSGSRQRMAMLIGHYTFLNEIHDKAFFDALLLPRGINVWSTTASDTEFTITIQGPCQRTFHREGDLHLTFRVDGKSIYRLAFSIIPATSLNDESTGHVGPFVIYIGQVQGSTGRMPAIRQTTKTFNDIAPPDLLMAAMAGLAKAWNIHEVIGVHPDQQIAAGTFSVSRSLFDYVEFWKRYGADLSDSTHFRMRCPFLDKPIAEIASRHRRRTLSKRALKADIAAVVEKSAESMMSRTSQT